MDMNFILQTRGLLENSCKTLNGEPIPLPEGFAMSKHFFHLAYIGNWPSNFLAFKNNPMLRIILILK